MRVCGEMKGTKCQSRVLLLATCACPSPRASAWRFIRSTAATRPPWHAAPTRRCTLPRKPAATGSVCLARTTASHRAHLKAEQRGKGEGGRGKGAPHLFFGLRLAQRRWPSPLPLSRKRARGVSAGRRGSGQAEAFSGRFANRPYGAGGYFPLSRQRERGGGEGCSASEIALCLCGGCCIFRAT